LTVSIRQIISLVNNYRQAFDLAIDFFVFETIQTSTTNKGIEMKNKSKSNPAQLQKHLQSYLNEMISVQHPWLKDFKVILENSIIGPLLFISFANTNKKDLQVYCIEAVIEQTEKFNNQLFDEHIAPYI